MSLAEPKSNELQTRLAELESLVEALQNEEVDAVVGARNVLLLRLKAVEEELRQHRDYLDRLVKERTRELEQANAALSAELARRQEAETELHALSRRLVQAQEEERRQIARELHDQTGQQLTVLSLLLDRALRAREPNTALLTEARKVVQELIGQVRNLSLDLRPSMLDDLGLVPTLLWHFERFTRGTQIKIEFQHFNMPASLPYEVSTSAYRIVQEALTNIARHAGVERACVRIWAQDNLLFVQVRDNGAGFKTDSPVKTGGLTGMKERARFLGGELTVESEPGKGTTITAKIPILIGT